MKTIIILLLLLECQHTCAQRRDSTYSRRVDDAEIGHGYLVRSRAQKTAAWVMLGSGLILYNVAISSWDMNGDLGTDAALIVGTSAIVGSIPMFISGARNKGRSEMLLGNRAIPLNHKYSQSLPSLGVRIGLVK